MSDDELEVYVYQGNDGEKVPRNVQHLMFGDRVDDMHFNICREYEHLQKVTFPDGLTMIGNRAFSWCDNLLEINKIPRTVEVIGSHAFNSCEKLKKVEYEDDNGTSPHQLKMIGERAFDGCESLERVKLTSSLLNIFGSAFRSCNVLVEANLSATCLTVIREWVFANCFSLLTVGLPNTITRIGAVAFAGCLELVTVVVPFDSQSITIEGGSFAGCMSLANLVLPQGSTVGNYESGYSEPFEVCRVLHARFGDDTTGIVAGLVSRFDAFPIHRLCYDHTRITVQELRQCIADQQEANSFVDEFGMTPLHIFFSTSEPNVELLEALLESLPKQVLCKDVNNRRPLDYLVNNWTDCNASLFQITVQKWMIDRIARWGATSWMETLQSKVQAILSEPDMEQRLALSDELHSVFEHYSNVEATLMLELALWKVKLRYGWSSDGAKRQAIDRVECRFLSGSDVVIPNVFSFLKVPQESEDDGSEGSSESES